MKAVSLFILAIALSLSSGLATEQKHEAAQVLSNDRLRLEIMESNAEHRYYTGIRFSNVAMVLRASLDGEDYLFSSVEHDPSTEGAGLAMEFDLFHWEEGPPGFADAAMGEGFLKIGVGVLKKSTETYLCFEPYNVISPAKTEVKWEKDRVLFHQFSEGVRGYAYDLESEITIRDATIIVRYKLTNTGKRPFATEHYTHNFFRFADENGGMGYEVELPFDFKARIPKTAIAQEGRVLRVVEPITPKVKGADAFIDLWPDETRENSLIARHLPTGKEIQAIISKPPNRVTVHVNPRSISPEQFVRIHLAPGESEEWTRTYHLRKRSATP